MAATEVDRKGRRIKRRRNGLVAFGNAVLTFVVLGLVAVSVVGFIALQQYSAPGPAETETAFIVDKNASLGSVSALLQDKGLITNNYLFTGAGRLLKKAGDLKPGQFTIPAKASMSDIMTILTETKPVEFFVTVPEGETSFQAAERVRLASNSLTGELTGDPAEGTILPGRYDWTLPTETRQSVLDQMQGRMKEALDKAWAGRDKTIDDVIKTPQDLLTLASLVEKETSLASERSAIASVFINRLRKGMRLQTDPSVLYGVTMGKAVLNRGPTTKELRAETAYNTYVIKGLPPGPIANPGEETLIATAHPDGNNNLYFVAKTDDPAAGHYFSATYAEHKKNVVKYRQAVKQALAEDAAEAAAAKDELEAQAAQAAGDTVQ